MYFTRERFLHVLILGLTLAVTVFSQSKSTSAADGEASYLPVYISVLVVLLLGAAAFFLRKKRKTEEVISASELKIPEIRLTYNEKPKREISQPAVKAEKTLPLNTASGQPSQENSTGWFEKLPLSTFVRLQKAETYSQFPESDDENLLFAIEQADEELEEDTQVRLLALRVLATHRNSNAVFAISQMARYDISSRLRAEAIAVLAEIDHESVFEAIVTACADPTREVRAAAARALFRLSIDRAQAWTRIIESENESRMRHAARAAIEAGLVERSFERLIHTDRSVAYEAFALTALLIKAGETEPIYRVLGEHKDEKVKYALLHVLQTVQNDTTFEDLSDLLNRHQLTPALTAKINEVRSYSQIMHA